MEIRERKFDVILLDVDGTLLDFGMSEKQGMKVVLEQYGFEPQRNGFCCTMKSMRDSGPPLSGEK